MVRAGVVNTEEQTGQSSDRPQELCAKIDSVASRLKEMINSGDQQLSSGVTKFTTRFDKISTPRMRPKLTSAFHQFGWEMGATTITQGDQLRHGKIIAVQATATGRRAVKSHGKRRQIPGHPGKHSFTSTKAHLSIDKDLTQSRH